MENSFANFFSFLKLVSEKFKSLNKTEKIRLISHHDADGICAASIMIKVFEKEGFLYELSIIKQLTEEKLRNFEKEPFYVYFFTDLGSGQYEFIKRYLSNKLVFIFDHHSFDINLLKNNPSNIIMANPHIFGIDGTYEISGSGVVYLFAEAIDESYKEYSYLALVGALGDIQEREGFISLNKKILETAIRIGKIKKEKNLKYFGLETKPLYYLLAYGDIYLSNISGKESNAIQFLIDNNIPVKKNGKWAKYNDLTDEEKESLVSAIIMKRKNEKNPEGIIGDRYLLATELESSPLRDLKEFSTLINACGRLEKSSLGIGVCLNDENLKKKAFQLMDDYRKEIVNGLNWYSKNDKEQIIRGKKFIIINAKKNILPSIIGTITSIVSNSEIEKGTLVMGMAHDGDYTKISLRIKGESDIDLREIIKKIASKVNGESGGHKNAAGAIILKEKENDFVKEFIGFFQE